MLLHGLHDCVLFALLAVFMLLSTWATVAQLNCKKRCQKTLWLAAAAILSGAAWAAYHFGAPDRIEILGHYASIVLAIVTASLTSRFAARYTKRQSADQAGAARFQTLAEAIPQIVWIADAKGHTTYINKRWYGMTGMSEGGGLGSAWIESVHADDRAPCQEKWEKCASSGETLEIEYRLHDATLAYRWYLDRAVPLRDEKGVIQQWFGTCTDIEEQKHYQEILEQQIKDRTEELAEANTPSAGNVGKRSRPSYPR